MVDALIQYISIFHFQLYSLVLSKHYFVTSWGLTFNIGWVQVDDQNVNPFPNNKF